MYKVLILLPVIMLSSCASLNKEYSFPIKNNSKNLYAFVGRKIELIETGNREVSSFFKIDSITNDSIEYISIPMDFEFKAKYLVLKNIYNEIGSDTVEFTVYDHYGKPKFENFENVLLYLNLNNVDSTFYHNKYQFDQVKKKRNGNWTGVRGERILKLLQKQY